MALLEVEDLSVEFGHSLYAFRAVDAVTYCVEQGKVLGIVGESGSGKSVSSLAVMGLINFPGRVKVKRLLFDNQDLCQMSDKQRQKIVGSKMAMIFQDPTSSLNPCYSIGYQIMETLKVHQSGSRNWRKQRVIELLSLVGIPDPQARFSSYPHQLSGGMNQRVMIAMAIACQPKLLIADEPTTALDVTIQGQIVDLLLELQKKEKMALIFISHDLALVSQVADTIMVMYAGQVVEQGPAQHLFQRPLHPYTQALLSSSLEFATGDKQLESLPGTVPGKYDRPTGCLLNPRCPYSTKICQITSPNFIQRGDSWVRCHTPLDDKGKPMHE